MSVIIKNMNMPKTCEQCDFYEVYSLGDDDEFTCTRTWQYTYEFDTVRNSRMSECPLQEIKCPHGRLVDADALNKAIRTDIMGGLNYEHFIKTAPTIIESEE